MELPPDVTDEEMVKALAMRKRFRKAMESLPANLQGWIIRGLEKEDQVNGGDAE